MKKSIYCLLSELNCNQREKLEKDCRKNSQVYSKRVEKVNRMLTSGYYDVETCKWLRKLRRKYLLKSDDVTFIKENAYNYINL